MIGRFAFAALAALVPTLAAAETPRLAFPAECVLGETCFIQNYPDADPGPGARDHACGPLSYDGHDGTDIALPDLAAMRAGVAVLAAAPGTVLGIRDGMADLRPDDPGAPDIAGRECGNGVLVDLGAGWTTQYCHLRQGSVAVATGDLVAAGQTLGLIGQSGLAAFPHVHLAVRHDGAAVDPFRPGAENGCGTATATLWDNTPAYASGGLIGAGFAFEVPQFDQIKDGTAGHRTLPVNAPALVFWVHLFGTRAGDMLRLTIDGPGGPFASHETVLDRTQARAFRAAGKALRGAGWQPGDYYGLAILLRDGTEVNRIAATVTLR